MDLATVKAKVKAWEKGFRATHSRDPTKSDIKADPGGIAELYALYRKLSKSQANGKSSTSSSKSAPPPSSSSTLASVSTNTSTPRKETATYGGPATPTPPARRRPPPPTFAVDESPENSTRPQGAPITPQKRAALFTTPKKKKDGYVGPVADPLPNPFSVTPRKNKTTPAGAATSTNVVVAREVFESPFIHASSPRKLKEVLEANSLRASRERANASAGSSGRTVEITPRTKARKRLAGEEVEGTPAKAPRRRRGDRPSTAGVIPGAAPASADAESDDEFGETPIKPGVVFGLMDDMKPKPSTANGKNNAKGKGKGRTDLFPIFQRAKRAADEAENGRAKRRAPAVPVPASDDDMDGPGSPTPSTKPDDGLSISSAAPTEDERFPTPPPVPPSRATSRTPRAERAHVLTLSEDEWDPEADTRTVLVTGTRRTAIRVAPEAGLASDDEMDEEAAAAEDEQKEVDEDDDNDNEAEATETSTTPLLSFLSLRSPIARAGERLADLRVRALLDPTSAAAVALRAARRGQEVFVCGEVDGEGDEWDIDKDIEGKVDDGDDDWESDPEGWKAVADEEEW